MNFADLLRRLRKRQSPADLAPPPQQHAYHAVAVIPGPQPCKAALVARGRRVLSRDAPPLPLQECTNPNTCRCHFAKFNDRRQEERRDVLSFSRWYPGTERRRNYGRRTTDR